METKDIKLLIGIPAYEGKMDFRTTHSLVELSHALRTASIQHGIRYIGKESLIPRARNHFAEWTLHDKFTHLLFIDSDLGFRAENILEMITLNKDVCGLPYTKKLINWDAVHAAAAMGVPANKLADYGLVPVYHDFTKVSHVTVSQPKQVEKLATGLMLIQAYVLKKMWDAFPERTYSYYADEVEMMDGHKFGFDFFQTGVSKKGEHYDSEDYRFCLDVQKLGYTIWMLPWAVTEHVGTHNFVCDFAKVAQLKGEK